MNNIKIFKIIILFISMFLVSCKQETKATKSLHSVNDSLIVNNSIDSTSNLSFLNKQLIQIVKQDNKYKLSCAKNYNKVILKTNSLYIEISEPIEYSIKKIVKSDRGVKIYFKDQDFYYDVSIVNTNLNISYWKNYNLKNDKLDTDYSFYAIAEKDIKKANLEKENCNDNTEISSWIGKYHLEVSSTHGDGKEVIDKYNIFIKDLNNIEFTSDNYKFIISGKFLNENSIEGDIIKIDKNNTNATTTLSPFITLSREDATFYIKCPLITQGAGFSSTPFEMEKE